MNSSLEKIVKNVSDDDDFKCLIKEFGSKNSELLKLLKVLILMSAWTVLKKLVKKKWLVKNGLVKDGTAGNGNGGKLDSHVSDEDYLTCNKVRNKFNMKNMGDYHDHYLKKMYCY